MSVSGRLSVWLIRCTGRYDNISFRIKLHFVVFIWFRFPSLAAGSESLGGVGGVGAGGPSHSSPFHLCVRRRLSLIVWHSGPEFPW